jgi:hypothetical protein
MMAASAALKLLYPNLFHVTCIAHLLHNCAEKVRSHFQDVDNLIARVKASTVKNKTRRQMFSDIGSPPEPIVTRWGSWLQAAEYYATNLVRVCEIVNGFDGDGIIVRCAKEAVNKVTLAQSLAQIQRDYMCIPKLISKLESSKCTMIAAYNDINNIDFKQDCVHIGEYINKRMTKNSDVCAIVKMERPDITPAVYAQIQCCQPTSAAVERSFSMLGKLLSKDRRFLPTNVENYLSLHYNKL